MSSEQKILTRDVEASVVPIGTKVTLQKGETAYITQSLGGTYTVVVTGTAGSGSSLSQTSVNVPITIQ